MCGIICIFSSSATHEELLDYFNVFEGNIIRRGPDSFDRILSSNNAYELVFGASVLWLQGETITKQPLENSESVFLYNGDIYRGLTEGLHFNLQSDTQELFKLFNQTKDISSTLKFLQGPYAFVYFDKNKEKLYFCRDSFGRKSMLIGKYQDTIILTSVAQRTEKCKFMELPSIGLFCWDLKNDGLFIAPFNVNNNLKTKLTELEAFLSKDIQLEDQILDTQNETVYEEPLPDQIHIYKNMKNMGLQNLFSILLEDQNWLARTEYLQTLLEESMRLRISAQPKCCNNCTKEHKKCTHGLVGVLFSGGVDCAILALLADKIIEKTRPIDLFNVSFDEAKHYKTPDRQTGLETLEELKKICPEREWRFHEVDIPKEELNRLRDDHIADLIYPLKTILDDSLGCALWFASRGVQNSFQSTCREWVQMNYLEDIQDTGQHSRESPG